MTEKTSCASGYAELMKKLRQMEKNGSLYRMLAEPQNFARLDFSLQRYWRMEAAAGQLEQLRRWTDFWHAGRNWQVEEERKEVLRGVRTNLPVRIYFSDVKSAFKQLNLSKWADEFLMMYDCLQQEFPEEVPWLLKFPRRIMEKKFYPGCIALGRMFQKGIAPGQYLREINVHGIDTKFMERDMTLTKNLWNVLCPEQSAANEKELRALWQAKKVEQGSVGIRMLDERLSWYGAMKFFLSAQEAEHWHPPVRRIFITENKVNGYRFPMIPESMILFGMGYGVCELARRAQWMREVQVYYWGDLDSNGFDILSDLRELLPEVKSLLMSPEICKRYMDQKVKDEGDCTRIPQRLTVPEKEAWAMLHEQGGRLEQERIPLCELEAALKAIEDTAFPYK